MKKQHGFTVIELVVMIAVFIVIGVFFLIQRNDLTTTSNDQRRKTAINSMYYNLTEVFYKENQFYPTSIGEVNLKAIDPSLFDDVNGTKIGQSGSEYNYEGVNCDINGKCQSFKLTTTLEKESEYIRQP
jgi:type II secretory pathway pseudopilin PulG